MKVTQAAVISFALALGLATLPACSKQPSPPLNSKSAPATILLAGTVELDEAVKAQADPLAVLFIIARNDKGQIAAVKKLFPPFQYPVAFSLTSEDSMIRGTALSGQFKVTARLDRDGNANPAQAGDIIGVSGDEWNSSGQAQVKILLNEAVK